MRLPHSCAISLSFLELFGPALLLQNKFPVLICWQNITYASFPCAPFLLLYWIFSLLCASQKHQVEVNKCGHKRRKQKSICHFSMLVRVKQYTVLFFFFKLRGFVSQLIHTLACQLVPTKWVRPDQNVNLSEQTFVSIDDQERCWYVLPAHTNTEKGMLLTATWWKESPWLVPT